MPHVPGGDVTRKTLAIMWILIDILCVLKLIILTNCSSREPLELPYIPACEECNVMPYAPESKMNRMEQEYADYLFGLKVGGLVLDYVYEPLKFRLGPKTFYTPDFLVVTNRVFEIHEVKGFRRDDAMVKLKVAAERYPWFKWKLITRNKDRTWRWQRIN